MFFFFQAEDGIRYLVRSRGLGDVYKRQEWFFSYQMGLMYWRYFMWNFAGKQNDVQGLGNKPVSYTHLTLPTSDLV